MSHPTTWYHGTTEEVYRKIQKDGHLLGVQPNGKRFTYLALDKEEADAYGEVTLRVDYDPVMDLDNNNFCPDSLDIKVTSPIPLTKLKRIC